MIKLQVTNYELRISSQKLERIFLPVTKPKAFTLIESLIVMVILATSMTAALYLLTTVVFGTQKNLARTKATYLAQECHELARNVRDTAWLNFEAWDCAFGAPGDEFIISTRDASYPIASCNNLEAATRLEMANSTNSILYQGGAIINHNDSMAGGSIDTGYRRILRHTDPDSSPETLDLECEVSWEFNGQPQQITTQQTLTNWRRN